jgi:DNA-binding transcriptional regulator YdaS (Cro superfamily)
MNSLYVCLFSTSHIKVGRSVDPQARIAAHADRVKVVGVELVDHRSVECKGDSVAAEAALIARCDAECFTRHANEWFEGIAFADACGWMSECASINFERRVSCGAAGLDEAITIAGSATTLASSLGVSIQVLSNWKARGGRVPAEYCPSIEKLTGVRCERLRPEVPWSILREQTVA